MNEAMARLLLRFPLMKTNIRCTRLRIAISLALTILGIGCAQASDEYLLGDWDDSNGNREGYYVTHERLAASPEWIFDGTTPPPTSLADAYRTARRWTTTRYPRIEGLRVRSYSVEEKYQGPANRWYYSFIFVGNVPGMPERPFIAIVLMDGSAVEPREITPNGHTADGSSPYYNSEKLAQTLKRGMSKTEVIAIYGKPTHEEAARDSNQGYLEYHMPSSRVPQKVGERVGFQVLLQNDKLESWSPILSSSDPD